MNHAGRPHRHLQSIHLYSVVLHNAPVIRLIAVDPRRHWRVVVQ
jgi:hypothetical protein